MNDHDELDYDVHNVHGAPNDDDAEGAVDVDDENKKVDDDADDDDYYY